MNDDTAIQQRRSRRAYADIPLSSAQSAILQTWVEAVNRQYNLTCFLAEDARDLFNSLRKSYGMFSGVYSALVLKGASCSVHLRERCGYAGD